MGVRLSFLWHMHQPYYLDKDGLLGMPWVFLHAIKDYYDMPWLVSKYPTLKATFNITPPLIKQLKIYEEFGCKKDRFLLNWIKKPNELHPKDKESLLKICKSASPAMIENFDRLKELYAKKELNDKEIVDLEVLFLLCWCGNYLRESSAVIKSLIEKREDFNKNDKIALLDELTAFIPSILPFYKKLAVSKQIALSTTPLNHPILPLLINMKNAKISNPKTTLPKESLSLKDDAVIQVKEAIKLYRETFSLTPVGFWPAEGAVDEESIEIYRQNGIKWIATDEAILLKSLETQKKELIYKEYSFSDIFIAFRDHLLSDKIGFHYRYLDADEASSDFMAYLENLDEDAFVSIIVDGENAWEFYRNNGYDFFISLYEKVSNSKNIKTVTLNEASRNKTVTLDKIHPGSWIYGTFDTWVGNEEKNRAWELLFQAKREIKSKDKKIKELFLLCECSDWFWWYGDDHYSDFLDEFDKLFRSNLASVYKLAGKNIPANLLVPILKKRELKTVSIKPQAYITPKIDGKESSFYEWLGAGKIDESSLLSTMDGLDTTIKKVYFCEDKNFVYLKLDGDMDKLLKNFKELEILCKQNSKSYTLPLKREHKKGGIGYKIDELLEISIDKKLCKNQIRVKLAGKRGVANELVPISADIIFEDSYDENWFI